MRKGFLIYEEMRKYFPIYEEAVCHIWLCNCSTLNFLIYEENSIFFFISVVSLMPPTLLMTFFLLLLFLSYCRHRCCFWHPCCGWHPCCCCRPCCCRGSCCCYQWLHNSIIQSGTFSQSPKAILQGFEMAILQNGKTIPVHFGPSSKENYYSENQTRNLFSTPQRSKESIGPPIHI